MENPAQWDTLITIRHATQNDLEALEWEGEYAHFRRVYADTYQRSQRGLSLLWVIDLPGKGIIGQAFVQLNSDRKELANGTDRAYIFAFRIRPAFRRKGLGSYLLKFIENDLLQRGYTSATLNVAKDNPDARRLYERHGYQVVAEEPGQWSYPDQYGNWQRVNEPAWRMQKSLKA
ncbi:MAG: GNAT family N-acetyltransferase [Anaerolineae bacterium]|nr:GNAT family N-acetyltransferase [Anaerolineae bacterium]